jgi:hypothetical protein
MINSLCYMLETPKYKPTRLIMIHSCKNGLDATMDNQQETNSQLSIK